VLLYVVVLFCVVDMQVGIYGRDYSLFFIRACSCFQKFCLLEETWRGQDPMECQFHLAVAVKAVGRCSPFCGIISGVTFCFNYFPSCWIVVRKIEHLVPRTCILTTNVALCVYRIFRATCSKKPSNSLNPRNKTMP
jgi:hypothetical protein